MEINDKDYIKDKIIKDKISEYDIRDKNDKYYIIDRNDEYFRQVLAEKSYLKSHAKIAHMDQIVISDEDKYIIGTTALDTCTGILFYDFVSKKGMVGHASPHNTISMIIQMLHKIDSTKKTIIGYSFVSGYRAIERKDDTAISICREYMEAFSKLHPNIKFVPQSIDVKICDNVLAYEFAFNTKTRKSENLIFMDNVFGKHR